MANQENVVGLLEFKLVYYDSAVQHFNHYITGTRPKEIKQESFQNEAVSVLL